MTNPTWRPVTVVDARRAKALELSVEVPVEDMARVAQSMAEIPSGPASQVPSRASIWTAIHPRLLELIRAHRSTLLFVNSRRLAERLAAALNELAGETLVRTHHGSMAREQRIEVEDLLKAGRVRALVATSTLELGIDMGAIDLVIQIEAPPSVASGLQRIGRASHQVDAASTGVIFPKFRGDLVACAAVTAAMHAGHVEASRYPRNPLDVLAQQIVAMVALDDWAVDDLLALVRRAAPFSGLGTPRFRERARHAVGALSVRRVRRAAAAADLGSPRGQADRAAKARFASRLPTPARSPIAASTACSLPGAGPGAGRVGELDEEMVFESRVGETFLLGASTWRIEEITHDRVVVSPAPGEPGKMPFWKGDSAGRPRELGLAIGKLARELARDAAACRDRSPRAAARPRSHRGREPAAIPRRSIRRRRRRP